MTKLFFATDVHGSDICWKKFISAGKFYKADVLILGGDLTGKAIVPIISAGGQSYRAVLLEQEFYLQGDEEVCEMEKRIRSRGYYPYRTTPDEIQELEQNPSRVEALFVQQVLKTFETWLTYADEKLADTPIRCFVSPGNDDLFALDEMVQQSKRVVLAEGRSIWLDDHHEMISTGWSTPTPWHTYREESEESLSARIDEMFQQVKDPRRCVFNFHVPPYDSGLDEAPELTADLRPKLAGNSLAPVGSRSVRQWIEKHHPLLGLFGHIHEGRGAVYLGRTLCVNPGSTYEQGLLCGALVALDKGKIKSHVLTQG